MKSIKNKVMWLLRGLYISKDFKTKLSTNFHSLTALEMLVYLLFIRIFWSKEKRFFFEGDRSLMGQMYIADRKALYDTVLKRKPRVCFEIGTYTGGGSTFFLSSALAQTGGELITMEIDEYYYSKAKNYYANKHPQLSGRVKFVHGSDAKMFDSYLKTYNNIADCVFFDGAEDVSQTLAQLKYFKPYLAKGSIIMMHDWNTDKMAELKPLIENDPSWKVILELNPPQSVGFAVAEKIY